MLVQLNVLFFWFKFRISVAGVAYVITQLSFAFSRAISIGSSFRWRPEDQRFSVFSGVLSHDLCLYVYMFMIFFVVYVIVLISENLH